MGLFVCHDAMHGRAPQVKVVLLVFVFHVQSLGSQSFLRQPLDHLFPMETLCS